MATIEKKTAARSSDERLIKQCLAGNEGAWAQLIEKYKSLIFSIPIKYGLPQQEAADVFQATCMELLARMAEIREPRALAKWLIQVAHHKCYHWKHQENRTVSRDTETGIPEPEAPPVAESLLRQSQEEQALREAMGTLKPRCRRLIELLFYEIPARPYAEIAADLGLAVGSIGFTRQQCLETLRRQLEKSGFA
jgi:RNA polymerase sigma factor (sigma-70 family)